MTWTTTKPDSPGVWWYCDGVSDEVKCYDAWVNGCKVYLQEHNRASGIMLADNADGYWLKQSPPAAFIAPKPPPVEMWLATTKSGKEQRFIGRVGEYYTALDERQQQSGSGRWSGVGEIYTLIRKVPQC